MDLDCGFKKEKKWFRLRAAAIIVEAGHVLFAGNAKSDYYYSVGGGVHHGETTEEAVVREVFEETGVRYEVDHLAIIHENFFSEADKADDNSLEDLACHEIAFYFVMKPRGTMELNSNSFSQGVREHMYWLPIESLDNYKAYPEFMKDYLQSPHDGIEHIVSVE